MKKILFLFFVATMLLAGCSIDEAARDTTAGMGLAREGNVELAAEGSSVEIPLKSIQCNGNLIPNTEMAQVIYRLELAEDALKLGGNGPYYLYGSGVLELKDSANEVEGKSQFTCLELTDDASVKIDTTDPGVGIIFVGNLPFLLEVSGVKVSVPQASLTGIALKSELKAYDLNPNDLSVFSMVTSCQGQFVPNSNVAVITFLAELKDGQQIAVSGAMNTGLNVNEARPRSFQCSTQQEGSFAKITTNLGNFEIQDLMLRTDNGKEFLLKEAFITGFNIGMPPA